MHAAYNTAVKCFICELIAIIVIRYRPNAAVNRFAFANVKIVGNRLIIGNVCMLMLRRRSGSIVHLIDAIHVDVEGGDDAVTTDNDDAIAIVIVSIVIVIAFVNIIVDGGGDAISAVQMLVYVIQLTD